jgi:hypothetical protein
MRHDARSWLLLALLVLVFLIVSGLRPGTLPFTPGARFSDAATSHFPAASFLRESVLERGEFPVWRNTIMAGQPFAANPLNKTAYPLQWLALIFPPALHLDLMILLHLFIAGWGMWRWTRTIGLRPEAAAVSLLAYVLSPRLVGHTGAGHVDLVYALAWFPWLMWAAHVAVRGTSRPLMIVARTGLLAALVFLADVRLSLFAFVAAGVYALFLTPPPNPLPVNGEGEQHTPLVGTRLATSADNADLQNNQEIHAGSSRTAPTGTRRDAGTFRETPDVTGLNRQSASSSPLLTSIRRLFWLAAAIIPFLMLTAPVYVPLRLWQAQLSRAELTAADAATFSLEPGLFLGLILPQHEGNIESLTSVGLSVLILAGIAIIMQPRRLLLWVILLVGAAWYALGANGLLWSTLTQIFPFLLWFRVPSRAWFIVALVAPLLAGYGTQSLLAWLEKPARQSVQRGRMIALMGLVGALACGGFTALSLPVPLSVGISIIMAGGGLALIILLALNGLLKAERLTLALLLLIFLDLGWTGLRWLEWRGEHQWLDPHRPLAEKLVEFDADRIYSPTYSLPQEVAEVYDLELFGGVDPYQFQIVVDAIADGSGVEFEGYSVVQPPLTGVVGDDLSTANRDAAPDTGVLAVWDVSHVVAAYPIDHDRLEWVDTIDDVYVYTNLAYAPDESKGTLLPRWGASFPWDEYVIILTLDIYLAIFSAGVLIISIVVIGALHFQNSQKGIS